MNANIRAYTLRAQRTVERIAESVEKGGPRDRAQAMADCAELHEITTRLYTMLFRLSPVLPDQVDPHTFRFRKYDEGTDNSDDPGVSSQGEETPRSTSES